MTVLIMWRPEDCDQGESCCFDDIYMIGILQIILPPPVEHITQDMFEKIVWLFLFVP